MSQEIGYLNGTFNVSRQILINYDQVPEGRVWQLIAHLGTEKCRNILPLHLKSVISNCVYVYLFICMSFSSLLTPLFPSFVHSSVFVDLSIRLSVRPSVRSSVRSSFLPRTKGRTHLHYPNKLQLPRLEYKFNIKMHRTSLVRPQTLTFPHHLTHWAIARCCMTSV